MNHEKYWGKQTDLAIEHFSIGDEKMPAEIIVAFAYIKKCAALANNSLGRLSDEKLGAVLQTAEKLLSGELEDQFPLHVWQTGSGTGSNMNVNEVFANYGNMLLGGPVLHANDDINMSQSSNDTFPTAMHIAAVIDIKNNLLPAVDELIETFSELEEKYPDVIKIGRTHLQDATPVKFSQEVSGWRSMLEIAKSMLEDSLNHLRCLAIGGTAVGTGINCPGGFREKFLEYLNAELGEKFCAPENNFHALTARDELVFAHGAVKALAVNMMKIANDVRFLASGPRCGYGELNIPQNEAGSSIMPGKVNPTQCEQVTMVAVQIMGNDSAISIAASQGNFELNVYAPVIAYNFIQSVNLLSDSIRCFCEFCAKGITVNEKKMEENMNNSLMLVTALSPVLGYDKAGEIAKKAHKDGTTLKQACLELGYLSEEQFDKHTSPEKMV